jgi:Domain of unknown function (DUF4382)
MLTLVQHIQINRWCTMNKFENHSKPLIWLVGLLVTVFVAGCGSDGGGSTQPGTMGVSMTDAPACGFDAVSVTVSKVRIHQSDTANENAAGWADITLNPPKKINLLDLKDALVLETLGETSLAAGHYTQLRLVLVPNSQSEPLNNSVVPSTTKIEEPLDTPSAIQTGIKLIHQFDVASGQRVDLLLDFDACKSIVARGNGTYALKPVIKVVPFALNSIQGFVHPSLLGNNVIVSAQQTGNIVRATVPNAQTGEFFLARLDPANYDVAITADGHVTAVIANVPVNPAPSITIISTSIAPINLTGSTTHSISGTVQLTTPATDDATVFVTAKQTFGSAPTVTVKSQAATLITGGSPGDYSYTLTLPADPPSLGQYSTPPITLTAQSLVAGKYTVEGSGQSLTDVYTNQSPSPLLVDISGGDKTSQNFTLTP